MVSTPSFTSLGTFKEFSQQTWSFNVWLTWLTSNSKAETDDCNVTSVTFKSNFNAFMSRSSCKKVKIKLKIKLIEKILTLGKYKCHHHHHRHRHYNQYRVIDLERSSLFLSRDPLPEPKTLQSLFITNSLEGLWVRCKNSKVSDKIKSRRWLTHFQSLTMAMML